MKKRMIAWILAGIMSTTALTGCQTATADVPEWIEKEGSVSTAPEYDSSITLYDTADDAAETPTSCDYDDDYDNTYDFGHDNNHLGYDNSYDGYTGNSDTAKEAAYGIAFNESDGIACMPYPDPDYYGNDGFRQKTYRTVKENAFQNTIASPLSTFGADVDTASYASFRRMVNDGYRLNEIPAGSIRTEELVNYFNYPYQEPKYGDVFGVNASIIDCPWNRETKLVNLGIKAKEIKNTAGISSNIVFLIDISGSMNDYDKLPLLQMGISELVDQLDENDRVSIVTYASSSDVVIAGVSGDKHSMIKHAVNRLTAGGSTNGGDGIETAYKLAEKYFIRGGNNRVIMATDGDLNVGVTSVESLEYLISHKKESGVYLSVLGFGSDNYNEAILETLANKGNGNYSYIDCLREAKKVLIDEFNSTLFTVAKDVKFQIEFNPNYVAEYRQIGYENRTMAASDFHDDEKDGGEIGSGHTVTILYEVRLHEKSADDPTSLRYQKATLSDIATTSNEWMTLSIRYKQPAGEKSELLTYPISKECYTKTPTGDTLFAAYVAECGMILNRSPHIGKLSITDVVKQVSKLNLRNEYQKEFADLIEML